ncbi:integrase [Streptomyces sp. SPB162]|nr:integrase [Streptomyces sp. SPB162]
MENVAVHQLRENTHTRYTACTRLYLIHGLGRKKLAELTTKDVRTWLDQLRTTCQCCARGLYTARDQPQCCAIGTCCSKRLSLLTLAYVHSVLKSALEHAAREEEIPRNVARNVRMGTPRPSRFEPLTADEARGFLAATHGHRLSALFELALRTGLRKGELLGLRWAAMCSASSSRPYRTSSQHMQPTPEPAASRSPPSRASVMAPRRAA